MVALFSLPPLEVCYYKTMSKKPKKRTKQYRGPDAATGPRVTRYSVGHESAVQSWWKEHKRVVLWRGMLVLAAVLLSWIIYSFIH